MRKKSKYEAKYIAGKREGLRKREMGKHEACKKEEDDRHLKYRWEMIHV